MFHTKLQGQIRFVLGFFVAFLHFPGHFILFYNIWQKKFFFRKKIENPQKRQKDIHIADTCK